MDKEKIDKIMFDNFLKSVPTMVVDAKARKTISTYGSIDVNDLMSAIDRLNKVPTYDELLKENKKQKEAINKIQMIVIDMQTELMKLQPYHSYVIDGNKVRNFAEDLEDILEEVSDEYRR